MYQRPIQIRKNYSHLKIQDMLNCGAYTQYNSALKYLKIKETKGDINQEQT